VTGQTLHPQIPVGVHVLLAGVGAVPMSTIPRRCSECCCGEGVLELDNGEGCRQICSPAGAKNRSTILYGPVAGRRGIPHHGGLSGITEPFHEC
jgi:hypothetical protein